MAHACRGVGRNQRIKFRSKKLIFGKFLPKRKFTNLRNISNPLILSFFKIILDTIIERIFFDSYRVSFLVTYATPNKNIAREFIKIYLSDAKVVFDVNWHVEQTSTFIVKRVLKIRSNDDTAAAKTWARARARILRAASRRRIAPKNRGPWAS